MIPNRWFSWDFTLLQGTQQVASVEMSAWREKAEFRVQDRTYRIYREGLIGDFVLETAGTVAARATKPSLFRREFLIGEDGRRYTLKAKSSLGRGFVLSDGGREIGSLNRESVFSHRAAVNLPEDLSLPLKVFIVWLVMILWKRAASAAT